VNGLYVLGGLIVAAGAFYVTTRILLRRELDRDASTKTDQPRGGGPDESHVGLVTRKSLAGGKGAASGPPGKPTRAGGTTS
jgi:hypothetical protein